MVIEQEVQRDGKSRRRIGDVELVRQGYPGTGVASGGRGHDGEDLIPARTLIHAPMSTPRRTAARRASEVLSTARPTTFSIPGLPGREHHTRWPASRSRCGRKDGPPAQVGSTFP